MAAILFATTQAGVARGREREGRIVGLTAAGMALFYGMFVWLWAMGGFIPDPAKGFLFNIPKYLGF